MSWSIRERLGRYECLALLLAVGCSSGATQQALPDDGRRGRKWGRHRWRRGRVAGADSDSCAPGVFTPSDCSAVVIAALVCSFDPAPNGYGVAIECVCVPAPRAARSGSARPRGPVPHRGRIRRRVGSAPASSVSARTSPISAGSAEYWPGRILPLAILPTAARPGAAITWLRRKPADEGLAIAGCFGQPRPSVTRVTTPRETAGSAPR